MLLSIQNVNSSLGTIFSYSTLLYSSWLKSSNFLYNNSFLAPSYYSPYNSIITQPALSSLSNSGNIDPDNTPVFSTLPTGDVPFFAPVPIGIVDETDLYSAPYTLPTVAGHLEAKFFDDGPGTFAANGLFSSTDALGGSTLTSSGEPVIVTSTTNGYRATAHGETIFTLQVAQDGTYVFELHGTIDHADTQNPDDVTELHFGVSAIDIQGDTAEDVITIKVHDDGPFTVDTGRTVIDGETVYGSVMEGDGLLGTDDFGEDGPGGVVQIQTGWNPATGNPVSIPPTAVYPNDLVEIEGEYGILTIDYYGQYEYNPHDNLSMDPSEVIAEHFTYTISDADGDTSSNLLVFHLISTDSSPVITAPDDILVVDETDLDDGFVVAQDILEADFGGDGPGTWDGINGSFTTSLPGTLTSGGEAVSVILTNGTYTGTTASGDDVFTLDIDSLTGAYNFTLMGVLDHPDGADHNDVITLNFGVQAIDQDGDTDETVISVEVFDDGPSATGEEETSVNESDINLSGSTSITGSIDDVIDFGEDGPNSFNWGAFSVVDQDGTPIGLQHDGQNIEIEIVNGNYVGTVNGQTIFVMTLNQNGDYNFTLHKGIDHPIDTDALQLQFGVTIMDGDGDKQQTTIKVNVIDSGPESITIGTPELKVDETHLADGDSATMPSIITYVDDFIDFGTDGYGYYALDMTGFAAGITSGGENIVISFDNGIYVGKTQNTNVEVFTLKTDLNAGSISFQLIEALDHSDTQDPDDIITLSFGLTATDGDGDSVQNTLNIDIHDDAATANDDYYLMPNIYPPNGVYLNVSDNDMPGADGYDDGSFTLEYIEHEGVVYDFDSNGELKIFVNDLEPSGIGIFTFYENGDYFYQFGGVVNQNKVGIQEFTYAIKDGDGDVSTATLTLEMENKPWIPIESIFGPDVDETDFDFSPVVIATDNLNVDFGNDGPGEIFGNGTFWHFSPTGEPLTSNGLLVDVALTTDGGYIGTTTENGVTTTIFTLDIEATSGDYTFSLFDNIDHEHSDHNDELLLHFGIAAEDSDGDTSEMELIIQVFDDGPEAEDDIHTFTGTSMPPQVIGNVLDNDDIGHDTNGGVTQVKFNGQTHSVSQNQPTLVVSQFGELEVNADGSYVYTYTAIGTNGTDNFSYTLTDGDGDKVEANLIFEIDLENADDLPVIEEPLIQSVDETNLDSGPQPLTGVVDVDFGNDGPGVVFANDTFSFQGVLNGTLTSNGEDVIITSGPTGYVGTANGIDIFTLTISPDGSFTFELLGQLDHGNPGDPNDIITLNFGIAAQDSDDDLSETILTIQVFDDGPYAQQDINLYQDGFAEGNVMDNDVMSQDAEVFVIAVVSNATGDSGSMPDGGTVVIDGQNGQLTLHSDGTYEYESFSDPDTDIFTYAIIDGDGDVSYSYLVLRAVDSLIGSGNGKVGEGEGIGDIEGVLYEDESSVLSFENMNQNIIAETTFENIDDRAALFLPEIIEQSSDYQEVINEFIENDTSSQNIVIGAQPVAQEAFGSISSESLFSTELNQSDII